MYVRLLIQPVMAGILATRAGLKDAREGRPAFLWAVLTSRGHRKEVMRESWRGLGTIFVVAVVLDAIYQLIVHHGVFVLELVIVAVALAVIPYVLLRGPVNRLSRSFGKGSASQAAHTSEMSSLTDE